MKSAHSEGSLSAQFGTPERVEWHLQNWRDWKRTGRKQGAWGYVAVGLSGGGTSMDFDDMVEESDRRVASIVDTLINDLQAVQSAAIHHQYLAAVFRFPRLDFKQSLETAKWELGKGLAKKGVY
jgi:hypothetical protein